MQEQSNISMACINDAGWERKFEFFTPHLWFNCQSVYCLFFRKENRWLCHSVCINCWSVCCMLSTEMIAILFVLWERHCYKVWIVVFMKGIVCPFWSYFPETLYDISTYFKMPEPLSQRDMLRGKQKRNLTYFVYTSIIIDSTQFDTQSPYFCTQNRASIKQKLDTSAGNYELLVQH